jgi:hypothetical protein
VELAPAQDAGNMDGKPVPGRSVTIILAIAILAAPFIATLILVEAGLIVMAFALGAGAFLLSGAIDVVPVRVRLWLRLGIVVNVTLAVACFILAAWLLVRR